MHGHCACVFWLIHRQSRIHWLLDESRGFRWDARESGGVDWLMNGWRWANQFSLMRETHEQTKKQGGNNWMSSNLFIGGCCVQRMCLYVCGLRCSLICAAAFPSCGGRVRIYTRLYSFRLDCKMVSLTAANTNLMFSVSEIEILG